MSTTICGECGATPAKFKLGNEERCATDFAAFAHWENTLKVAQETVEALAPEGVTYTVIERENMDEQGRFMLTGPDEMLVSDSLDAIIAKAEEWAGVVAPIVESPLL
jgi:hypothetical protein